MSTHNHTRKPNAREHVAQYCAQCGLTAIQVLILGQPTCCDAPSMHPKSAARRNSLTLFPQPNVSKPQCARSAELLPTPQPPYCTVIITPCDDCGGDGRNHHIDDDYEPCEFCGGSGEQAEYHNWLGEFFQLEGGLLTVEIRREHLTAIKHYATKVLEAYNNDHAREVA